MAGRELVQVRLTDKWAQNGYDGGGLKLRKGEVVVVSREVLTDRQDLHPGCFEEVEGGIGDAELLQALQAKAADLVATIAAGDWDDHLVELSVLEADGKARKTVLSALDERAAALEEG